MRSLSRNQWVEMQATYWDRQSAAYDQLYKNSWSLLEDEETQRRLSRFLPTSGRVLDLACGTGLGFLLCKAAGFHGDYVGMDLSHGMLSRIASDVPDTLLRGMDDLSELLPESFEAVFALNTSFSFAYEPISVVREAMRILKPGGVIFLSGLSQWSLRRLVRLRFGPLEAYRTRGAPRGAGTVPAHCFSAAQLKRWADDASYHQVRVEGQSFFGGVLELPLLWRVDLGLASLLPNTCHQISVTATKPDFRQDQGGQSQSTI